MPAPTVPAPTAARLGLPSLPTAAPTHLRGDANGDGTGHGSQRKPSNMTSPVNVTDVKPARDNVTTVATSANASYACDFPPCNATDSGAGSTEIVNTGPDDDVYAVSQVSDSNDPEVEAQAAHSDDDDLATDAADGGGDSAGASGGGAQSGDGGARVTATRAPAAAARPALL